MPNDPTTFHGGAPVAPPSRRRALRVATGVAGLTGIVGLAALGGLAARDDAPGGAEQVADSRGVAPRTDDGTRAGGEEQGPAGGDQVIPDPGTAGPGAREDGGRLFVVPCDDDALIDALTLANRNHGGTLRLADNCTYELRAQDPTAGVALPVIRQDVTVEGSGSTITRDAEDAFRLFRVTAGGDLTLRNLTVSGGHAGGFPHPGPAGPNSGPNAGRGAGEGGALLVERGGTARLAGVTLAGNNAEHHGGALANYGRTWLRDSWVVDNHTRGDGAGVVNQGLLTVRRTRIDHNSAGADGGGIANRRGGVVEIIGDYRGRGVSPSTLSDNRAGGNGGGLSSGGGFVTVSFTAITGNTAGGNGGGLYAVATDLDADEAYVAGNHADGDGGGVLTSGGTTARIVDGVIVGNTADGSGGGVHHGEWLVRIEGGPTPRGGPERGDATLTVRDTDILANTARDGGGVVDCAATVEGCSR
ncbi:hypothetical protein [Micromonospora sp. DT31]|uniref:hypothetical protein n=1 Tax=Micromonospora sp. DT31 TaxID=3393434 RepID=UPI003CECC46F